MTKQEIITHLSDTGGILNGTTRPAIGRQLDYWEIEGSKYMVTTSFHWSAGIQKPGEVVKYSYRFENIIRIELLTEIL